MTGKRRFHENQRRELLHRAEMGNRQAWSVHEQIIKWARKHYKYDDAGLPRSAKSYFDVLQSTLLVGRKDINILYDEAEQAESEYARMFGDVAFNMSLFAARIGAMCNLLQNGSPAINACAFEALNFEQQLENLRMEIAEKDIKALVADPSKLDSLDVQNLDCQAFVDCICARYRGKDLFDPSPSPIISDVERDLMIKCYEQLHPDEAKTIDEFLVPISECGGHGRQVQEIKYIAYASPDPCHSVFFKYLPQISIADHHVAGVQHANDYWIFGKSVYIDIDRVFDRDSSGYLSSVRRGGYGTLFHEIAHTIDYLMGGRSKELDDEILRDVNNGIRAEIECHFRRPLSAEDEASVSRILESLQKGNTTTGDPSLDVTRSKVVNYFNNVTLDGGANDTSADAYGGVTDNNISGTWTHFPSSDGKSYWSDHQPSTEFFANAFSRRMTGYAEAQNSIKENLPEATRAFENMISAENH